MSTACCRKRAAIKRHGKVRSYGLFGTAVSVQAYSSFEASISNSGSVFRGCVALAYPDTWNGGRDPLREDIVLQEETIPLVNGQAANHDGTLVHFDLEPQNGESLSDAIEI